MVYGNEPNLTGSVSPILRRNIAPEMKEVLVTSPEELMPQEAPRGGTENTDTAAPSQWEIDKVRYQEAWKQKRHLGNLFHVTLGFFVAGAAWYLTFAYNRPYLGALIGIVFLFLLMMLAKTTRVAEDNERLVQKFEKTYRSKHRFKLTGAEGISNFISFGILSALTAYFLLLPFWRHMNYHRVGDATKFALLSFSVFLLTYFILGDGELGRGLFRRFKTGRRILSFLTRKTKQVQALAYITTFSALALYMWIVWF